MEIVFWFAYMLVIWFVIAPVNTLLHEIGHALPALWSGSSPATIVLGNGDPKWRFRIGRLTVSLSPSGSWIGFYRMEKMSPVRWKRVLIHLMGPVFSLLTAAMWWWLSTMDRVDVFSLDFLLRGASYAALFQFIMTIVPMRYGDWNPGYSGHQSDGLSILREFVPERSVHSGAE